MSEDNKIRGTNPSKSKGDAAGVDFDGLRPGMCKFPLGDIDDPPERFCGAVALDGSPYCQSRAKKAYNKLERRRQNEATTDSFASVNIGTAALTP